MFALAVLLGLGLIVYTVTLLFPFLGSSASTPGPKTALAPAFDYTAWHRLPVQDGRIKPLETECMELVRQITGRTYFENTDPVALVLAWMLLEGKPGLVDWERYPFVLCDHHGLREVIFRHDADPKAHEPYGKYISPAELRASPGLDELLAEVARQRRQLQEKAHYQLSTVHLKAEEVARRLGLYDSICSRLSTKLHTNAMIGDKYLELQEFAELEEVTPAEALKRLEQKQASPPNPLRIVSLPKIPGSDWFSITELQLLRSYPARWKALLDRRIADSPQRYLKGEAITAMRDFENALAEGRAGPLLDGLEQELGERRSERIKAVRKADGPEEFNRVLSSSVRSPMDQEVLRQTVAQARRNQLDHASTRALLVTELARLLAEHDQQALTRLRRGAERVSGRPDDPEMQLLPMLYVEARFPDAYRTSAPSLEYPSNHVKQILRGYRSLQSAYGSGTGTTSSFSESSRRFLGTIRQVGNPAQLAEADRNLPWELLLNRTHPFRWAWVVMLAALVALVVSLQTGWRTPYWAGAGLYLIALLIQCFGFVLRIGVAGRAPVGNMYETVVFVAFLSALFALMLELIYLRKVIALAGAFVATLGLLLADQLPLALDPKISPLVPVLRSNFWLTVHVLTIVASYAGATLAWGLGNISLALLAFGKPNRETLKTLSLYTYRAMQIAVVLLAAGTFLGAWWASEAWGRYWGWDPKEVGALIALVCYVIPLHARYAGWIKDFGLAVAAVLCYAAIILSWYVINFVIAAGLHSYGFSGGGGEWVLWAGLINLEWVLVATGVYSRRAGRWKDTEPSAS
jgi:ABC-type transport system involved in cytochrome c biogenesis permease subunit